MINEYKSKGYVLCKNFVSTEKLKALETVLISFHEAWTKAHKEFYESQAVNSAYLTGTKYLSSDQRMTLFSFVCQEKLLQFASELIPEGPAFMNTQLFFNPVNPDQKNYWHRDIQYNGMSIADQQEMIQRINVIHFRIPVRDEPGMEFVPGSHVAWDTNKEQDVRLANNGCAVSDDLSTGVKVPLKAGDLLIFSANMIHRGLYGGDRLSFDILLCDRDPDLLAFAALDCLPDENQIAKLAHSELFTATRRCMKTAEPE